MAFDFGICQEYTQLQLICNMKSITTHSESLRALTTGILMVFAGATFFELPPRGIGVALLLGVLTLYLAKKTAQHFHGGHTHEGDAVVDFAAPAMLLLANILHPALDGFTWHQVLTREGFASAALVGLGIILHEIVRQSALISAFEPYGIKWQGIVFTAAIGILLGVGAAILGSTLLARHEVLVDSTAIASYTFVIGEFFFSGHGTKRSIPFMISGALLGLVFVVLL
jgi:hypothetical protein